MDNCIVKVGGIEKFSIVDFPSKIAAVVFMQGCPWRCPFCYNQSLQNYNAEGETSWENFIHLLEHRKGVIDAVVFSGGEPLMQPNLANAVKQVKDMGYIIGLHTGGYNPDALQKVITDIDWIGFDIKAPLEEQAYKKATGGFAKIENVMQSLQIILDSGIKFECRTTCDPRILDIQDIYTIADTLHNLKIKEYHIQKYRPIPSDTITQESECEKFFKDEKVLIHLKKTFETFEARK